MDCWRQMEDDRVVIVVMIREENATFLSPFSMRGHVIVTIIKAVKMSGWQKGDRQTVLRDICMEGMIHMTDWIDEI